MAGPSLTPAQLRSHIEDARRKGSTARVIGVQASGGWDGGDRIECGGETYSVVRADSPLAVRAALRAAESSPIPTVLLTTVGEVELGSDVRARLARRQLLSLGLWESVCSQFQARDVAPAARITAVGQALLEYAPAGGYPPAPTGLLDPTTMWRCVFQYVVGTSPDPTEAELIRWAVTSPAAGRYSEHSADLREAIRRRLVETAGPGAAVVLDIVEGGKREDAAAVGLVLEVLSADDPIPHSLAAAAARLERFHGGRPVPPGVGQRVARAAGEMLARLPVEASARHRRRADAILAEIQGAGAAHRGSQTPGSWEARLARYAEAVVRAVAEPAGPPNQQAVADVRDRLRDLHAHALHLEFSGALARAEAAARLLVWLSAEGGPPTDPAALAAAYRDDGAFADWARDRMSGGEAGAALSAAYRRVEEAAHRRRVEFNRTFATAVSGGELAGALPVERVIETFLLPLIGQGHRVLLILVDGLSWAVAHELLPDLRSAGWHEQTWDTTGAPPPSLLAAIPSVTEFSRTSLFCGRITRGDAATERAGFAAHAGLAAACDRKNPPVLSHKATVSEGPRGGLNDDVRRAVESDKGKVVAVVVNAVDDDLAGAEQVRGSWSVDSIRPLAALLQAAQEGGRLVILAGDHGHVLHRDRGEYRKAADAGERWRPASSAVGPGEIMVCGPRVQDGRGGDKVIVPWDEGIRYGVSKKGYHGGITPQELLAPLLVLSHTTTPARKGLTPCHLLPPGWWEFGPALLPPSATEPAPPPPARRPTGTLLDLIPPEGEELTTTGPAGVVQSSFNGVGWVDRLMGSDVYKAQRAAAGKHLPTEDEVRRSLAALEAAGGALTLGGFARQAGVQPIRLDGFLAKLQRILNIDGYEALGLDRTADRVSLNMHLLARQFELDAGVVG